MAKEDRAHIQVPSHSPRWDMFFYSSKMFLRLAVAQKLVGAGSNPCRTHRSPQDFSVAVAQSPQGTEDGDHSRWCSWEGFLEEGEFKLSFGRCWNLLGRVSVIYTTVTAVQHAALQLSSLKQQARTFALCLTG